MVSIAEERDLDIPRISRLGGAGTYFLASGRLYSPTGASDSGAIAEATGRADLNTNFCVL